MSRPLFITDCDEVLLHMVSHFKEWLEEAHGVAFRMDGTDFANALHRDGETLSREEIWPLLNGFFRTEMDRQTLVPGAADALARIGQFADVVILTNILDEHRGARADQLRVLGIDVPVHCNQGGKGDPVARLVAEYGAQIAVFVDDLPQHHRSVADKAPEVFRLHMVAEPLLAERMPPAPAAHVRIDDWNAALPWIEARLAGQPL